MSEREQQMQHRMRAAAAAAVLSLALAVAACGGGSSGDSGGSSDPADLQGQKVTFWIMNNGPDPVADTERIVKPFEDETGIDVDVQLVGWDVMFDRIRNAAVSGSGPDVTQAGTTQVPFFAALGGFEDLSDRVGDIGGAEAYPEGTWATTQLQGTDGDFAVPWFTEARTIYYRKDVLEQAGIDEATAFTDWDAFRSTLETIKAEDPSIQPFGTPGKKAYDLVQTVMPFVWDAGGSELSEDATTATVDSPEAKQGVSFITDLIADGLFDTSQLERDGTQVENQYKGGRLAVWIGGPWVLGSAPRKDDTTWSKAARANIGVAPMPKGPTGEAYTFVGGSNLMMFKSSEHKAAAWELIRFLSTDEAQREYADLLGMFPARLEPQQAVGAKDENHGAFLEAIQQGRSFAAIPQWGQVENAYKTRFGNILDQAAAGDLDDASLDQQLSDAKREADSLLQQAAS